MDCAWAESFAWSPLGLPAHENRQTQMMRKRRIMQGMKRKAEYIEGRKARENFENAMKAAFQIPKEKAPAKPKPKRRKASGSDKG